MSAQNPLIPFSLRKFHLIHFIAQSDQSIEFAKILQEAGFDLAPTDHVGNTPLIWSIANASNRFAADFLDLAKANSLDIGIDKTDNYFAHNTALHLAVAKGYLTKDSEERPLRTRPKSFLPNKQQPHKRQFNHCERGGELSLAVLPKSSAFF